MKITVKIYNGDKEILTKVLGEGAHRVGRSEFCDVVLEGEQISRSHLELRVTPASVYMTNMSGAGKVKLNQERVETAEVKDGDELLLGPYRLIVLHGDRDTAAQGGDFPAAIPSGDEPLANASDPMPDANPNESPRENVGGEVMNFGDPGVAQPAPQERGSLQPIPFGSAQDEYPVEGTAALVRAETVVEPKPLVAKLLFTDGPRKNEELMLETYEIILGRSRKADVFLDDEKLSRQHAKITRVGMGYRLIDMNSRNGTYVNGMRVLEHPLNSFDVIELGNSKIKFLISDVGLNEAQRGGPLTLVGTEQTKSYQPSADQLEELRDSNRLSIPVPPRPESALANNRTKLYAGLIALLVVAYFLIPSSNPKTAPTTPVPVEQTKGPEVNVGPATPPALYPKEFGTLTAKMQRDIEGFYTTALKFADQKAYDQAILQLKKIHEILPYYKNSRTLLDEYAKQLQMVRVPDKPKPNNPEEDLAIYLEEGMSYLSEGDFDRAVEPFRQALTIDPKNQTAVKGLKAAEAKVRRFEDIPPERDPEQEKKAKIKALFEEAVGAFKEKSYQKAIKAAQEIRTIELKGNTSYLNEAKQIIDRAQALQKEEFEPFLIQAKEKYNEGDYNAARDLTEEMLKRDPEYEEAKELFQKSKKQLHKLAKEAYTTGYILVSMNRIQEACQYFNRSANYVRVGDEYYNKVKKMTDQYCQ